MPDSDKSRCHRGAVGSPREAWGSRSNLELRSEGSPSPRPRSQRAATGFAWVGSAMRAPTLSNAFVRWNALECARGGHKSGHKLNGGRISEWATCCKQWWAGTGLNRRHQDFQSYSPIRVSARNCLMSNDGVTTAACAGVLTND